MENLSAYRNNSEKTYKNPILTEKLEFSVTYKNHMSEVENIFV